MSLHSLRDNFTVNSTRIADPKEEDEEELGGISPYFVYQVSYLSIVAAIGLLFNLIVLVKSIQYERSLKTSSNIARNSTNWLVISLALSDVGTSIFTIPFTFLPSYVSDFPVTERFCKYVQPLRELFISVSIYSVTLIAVGRYLILLKLFRKKSISSWIVKNVILWVLCYLIFALPFSAIYTLIYDDGIPTCEAQWSSPTASKVNVTVGITINLFLPALLVFCSYIGIIHRLRKARMIVSPQVPDKPQTTDTVALATQSHHIVKVSLLLLVAFFVTYLPHAVVIIAMEYGYLDTETFHNLELLYVVTLCLLYSSVAINPLILIYSSEVYRPKWLRNLYNRC